MRFARTGLLIAATTCLAISTVACTGSTPANNPAPTIDFHQTDGPTPGFPGHGMTGMAPTAAAATTPGAPPRTAVLPPAAAQAIDIQNFTFTPATLTVPVGTAVTWTNRDEEPHTVSANDASFRSPGLGHAATFTFTFNKAGTFDYICTIHPFMRATVVVTK